MILRNKTVEYMGPIISNKLKPGWEKKIWVAWKLDASSIGEYAKQSDLKMDAFTKK
jgi:hypothetical protein